ncbi:HNH endonuclease [Syntrophotalea acetylenica]|nr:HNH endonuclease [Syntrophotalea acetylenica]
MEITTDMTIAAYGYAKTVLNGDVALKDALNELEEKYGMNRGSANDYIYNLRHMLKGERYTRTNNSEATEYFLQNILFDFGEEAFVNALMSVDKHIEYYKKAGNSKLPGIRKIYKKYLSLSKIVLMESHSWKIESLNSACKVLDKSAFRYNGTGIPIEIRPFFIYGQMSPPDSRPVTLLYAGQTYDAHIEIDNQPTPRTRLFWRADFESLLKQTFPQHHNLYSQDQQPDSDIILRFERVAGFERYQVSFACEVSEDTALGDIQSEELEEKGPQREGAIKEYFGKRYERNSVNRKEAIRIHGLTCNACGFNFEKVYGARGADFIEVHHLKPIHTFEEEQQVDPKTDLTTVCSNCHRMIHRDPDNVLSLEALKIILSSSRLAASE